MFAKAEHLDVFHDHHFVISDIEKCAVQNMIGIHSVAAGQVSKRSVYPPRRFDETVTRGVFADLFKYFSNVINHETSGPEAGPPIIAQTCSGIFEGAVLERTARSRMPISAPASNGFAR